MSTRFVGHNPGSAGSTPQVMAGKGICYQVNPEDALVVTHPNQRGLQHIVKTSAILQTRGIGWILI